MIYLLRGRANPSLYNSEGQPPAFVAGLSKAHAWPEIVTAIVQSGGTTLLRSSGGGILHFAVEHKMNYLVRVLLENGEDPKARDGTGRDAFTLAKDSGNEEATQILMSTRRIYFPDARRIFDKVDADQNPSLWISIRRYLGFASSRSVP